LDPFLGSGTTLKVAKRLNRNGIGIELNERFIEMAKKRIGNDLFNEVQVR
jgi:DNA methylase N-4/N-6 domain-containing protein